jgi:ribosomal protein S18 acetylase RimI-like enzyme
MSPPVVTLVRATPADLDLLTEWMQGLRNDDPMPAATLADSAVARQTMAEVLADDRLGSVWIIRRGATHAGYAVLAYIHSIEFGGRCAFLDELYVAPEHRGGVGRAALSLLQAEASALGVQVLLLEVSPENEHASRLYQSAGFETRKYRLCAKLLRPSR